ncbi:helix-turn-helix domain-containing protein [Rubrobacter taiwanensis]|uniref:Helix-turn-helix domain-containing protein n=1 Tax=Rubrobacter taiwanensis TaxID=185139 RepID=A0A4R1BI46_9ACTN|nr:helix-turn-helix domain-containing protein [Rubrobacter taiwanensis]
MAGEKLAREFGALVRRMRLEQGLSQERPGGICGLHRNCIGTIERAERIPSIVVANKIVQAFGLSLSDLFLKKREGG